MQEATDENLNSFVNRIVELFQPEQIILFGSRAYGEPHPLSDYDLFIIMEFKGRPLEKSLEIANAIGNPWNLDIHVKTREEAKRRFEQHSPLTRAALTKGKVLYERDSRRMVS